MDESVSAVTYQNIPQAVNGLKVRPKVGVLDAPDDHYRPVLYSPVKAQTEHKQINRDVYEESKPYKPEKKKIPPAVWVILGAILSIPVFKIIGKLFKKTV